MRIDNLGIRGCFYVGVGSDTDDAIAAHEHTHSRSDSKVARIEQTRVVDHKIAFWNVCNLTRETLRPNFVCRLLGLLQLRNRRFERSWNDREPA